MGKKVHIVSGSTLRKPRLPIFNNPNRISGTFQSRMGTLRPPIYPKKTPPSFILHRAEESSSSGGLKCSKCMSFPKPEIGQRGRMNLKSFKKMRLLRDKTPRKDGIVARLVT